MTLQYVFPLYKITIPYGLFEVLYLGWPITRKQKIESPIIDTKNKNSDIFLLRDHYANCGRPIFTFALICSSVGSRAASF